MPVNCSSKSCWPMAKRLCATGGIRVVAVREECAAAEPLKAVRTVAGGKRFLGSGVTDAVLALQSLTATESATSCGCWSTANPMPKWRLH
jgi:hypothetical protein